MGITKSLMNTGSRAIFNRMSALFKDSPRLQGLVAKGADLISPDGPDKSTTSNTLIDLFKRRGLTLLQDQLSNGSHNQTPLAELIKTGETEALEAFQNPSKPVRAGTDLMSLLHISSVPITQTHSNVDAAFEDWTRSEKASRAEFGHTERQLRETQNIVYMLQTDLRNDPGNAEIGRRLDDAKQNAERALDLHSESMDKRHAIVEQGRMFGHQAETLMANEPVPVDWNRPKDFIPDNWDQPAGPSR